MSELAKDEPKDQGRDHNSGKNAVALLARPPVCLIISAATGQEAKPLEVNLATSAGNREVEKFSIQAVIGSLEAGATAVGAAFQERLFESHVGDRFSWAFGGVMITSTPRRHGLVDIEVAIRLPEVVKDGAIPKEEEFGAALERFRTAIKQESAGLVFISSSGMLLKCSAEGDEGSPTATYRFVPRGSLCGIGKLWIEKAEAQEKQKEKELLRLQEDNPASLPAFDRIEAAADAAMELFNLFQSNFGPTRHFKIAGIDSRDNVASSIATLRIYEVEKSDYVRIDGIEGDIASSSVTLGLADDGAVTLDWTAGSGDANSRSFFDSFRPTFDLCLEALGLGKCQVLSE